MNTYLMYRDRDADPEQELPPLSDDLIRDLGLTRVIDAMAGGDHFLRDVARRSLLNSLFAVEEIVYRQDAARDGTENSRELRSIYALAGEAIHDEGRNFWGLRSRRASSILRRSVEVLAMFMDTLEKIRAIGTQSGRRFTSKAWCRFFSMMNSEISDDYLERVRADLRRVEFSSGIPMCARLGNGNRSTAYILRDDERPTASWLDRLLQRDEPGYSYELHPRDESGARALSELGDRGVNLVANALAQAADHILAFLITLRYEAGFYVACLNLYERLSAKGGPLCFPSPLPTGDGGWSAAGLYDPAFALETSGTVVGNEYVADHKRAIIVTGANGGGKSTFLRALGTSQLMLQAGMFVPASSMRASLCRGLFSHYKREEDDSMTSGKLDEELRRMSGIVPYLCPGALVLFNESFAATNEREGSEIAFHVLTALNDCNIRIAFVTHLYDFAHRVARERKGHVCFLRAERETEGRPSFELTQGEPLPTSYGGDLYRRIFADLDDDLIRQGARPAPSEP